MFFAQNKNRHKFPRILDVCRNVEYNAASDRAKMQQKIINELLKTESAQKQAKTEGSDKSCMAAGMESNKHLQHIETKKRQKNDNQQEMLQQGPRGKKQEASRKQVDFESV